MSSMTACLRFYRNTISVVIYNYFIHNRWQLWGTVKWLNLVLCLEFRVHVPVMDYMRDFSLFSLALTEYIRLNCLFRIGLWNHGSGSWRSKILGPYLVKALFLLGSLFCILKHQMIPQSERNTTKCFYSRSTLEITISLLSHPYMNKWLDLG